MSKLGVETYNSDIYLSTLMTGKNMKVELVNAIIR